MIFQPMGGGSGGLGVVASGTIYASVDFDRPAVCVFASPRDAEADLDFVCQDDPYIFHLMEQSNGKLS